MKNTTKKVCGMIMILAGMAIGSYHSFFIAPGVCKKLTILAEYAEHVAGIGGVMALVVPFLISLALIGFGIAFWRNKT